MMPAGTLEAVVGPFVAPPPSRNAYVPPPKEAPQVKSYRRDEDPEIAYQHTLAAQGAGLEVRVGHRSDSSWPWRLSRRRRRMQ